MPRLPLSRDVLSNELQMMKSIVEKWEKLITDGPGVPSVDCPGNEAQMADYLIEMIGELQLVSQKADSIAGLLENFIGGPGVG